MLRRKIQYTNGMPRQYFFRVQNESIQLARTAWVHLGPQQHFEERLVNNQLNFQWKLHLRVDRETFELICRLVAQTYEEKILISWKKALLEKELLLHFGN